MTLRIYLESPPLIAAGHFQSPVCLSFRVTPSLKRSLGGAGILTWLSITYAFRPRLRDRLTLSGLTFLRKPWVFGEQVSRLFYRYSCRHRLFRYVHNASRRCFDHLRNAPLPSAQARIPSFGTNLESRVFSALNHLTSELLRFL